MSALGDAAVCLAERGWCVFPLRPRLKTPMYKGGFLRASADPAHVAKFWSQHPYANIGLYPGPSHLLVIDIDGPTGEATAHRLGLSTLDTLTVRTGRKGGLHRYLNHPGGIIGNAPLGPGVDVRADKGYVLAPPSVHPSGGIYKWENELVPIRSLTEHELAIIVSAQSGRERTQVATMEQIAEGDRHRALACYTGQLLAKGLSEDEVSVLVHQVVGAKCEGGEDGMEPGEVDAIVHDIARADRPKSVRGAKARSSEPSVFDTLLAVLTRATAELWHTKDWQAYSSMMISGHPDHLPVKSKAFKQFLLHGFAQVRGKPAPSDAVESTIALFEARAIHDGPEYTIHTRIAREADMIYLDLANPEREVVRIDATGWEIITNAPVRFYRPATIRPLPRPVRGGSVDALRPFVTVRG